MYAERALKKIHTDKSGGAGTAILVVIVVIILIGVGFYAFAGNSANVEINVYSTHVLADTDVTVYVDDKEIGTYHIDNLSGVSLTYTMRFSGFDDSKIITVKAISTGGYLGSQSDSELVTVYAGKTAHVSLYV